MKARIAARLVSFMQSSSPAVQKKEKKKDEQFDLVWTDPIEKKN
jgi:hypothetical protein